jgi:hypothetical protein
MRENQSPILKRPYAAAPTHAPTWSNLTVVPKVHPGTHLHTPAGSIRNAYRPGRWLVLDDGDPSAVADHGLSHHIADDQTDEEAAQSAHRHILALLVQSEDEYALDTVGVCADTEHAIRTKVEHSKVRGRFDPTQ